MKQEGFQSPASQPRNEQADFFDVLDNNIPNEDVRVFAAEKFGPEVRFDPKQPSTFVMYNHVAQMVATVEFSQTGSILDIALQRYGGEGGSIEKSWHTRFKKDALAFIAEHGPEIGVVTTH